MAEFEDFLSYIQAIDAYGRHAGIVKIIPPKEWLVSKGYTPSNPTYRQYFIKPYIFVLGLQRCLMSTTY